MIVKVPYSSNILGLSRNERKSLHVLSYFKTTLISERAESKWFINYKNVILIGEWCVVGLLPHDVAHI